jgi:Fe-S cluster assembly protein SufB
MAGKATWKVVLHSYRDENQLHAAVVGAQIKFDDAQIKYSTIQNWYPGDKDGVGHL